MIDPQRGGRSAGALALVMAWSLLPTAGAEDQPADPLSEPPAPASIGFEPDLSKNPDPDLIDTVVLPPEGEAEEIKAVVAPSDAVYEVIKWTVSDPQAADLNVSMEVGQVLSFGPLVSQLEESFSQDPLIHLEYLTGVSVSTRQGLLCYGYSTPDMPGRGVGGSERFYVNLGSGQKRLSDITFVPAADFGGDALISYTGSGSDQTRKGRIRIHVENSGAVAYHTANTRPVPFAAEDFVNVCKSKTGKTLRSVRFRLPPASQGTLYYQYSTTGQYSQRVTDTEDYRVAGGSTLLENVSFLPAKGFTGTVRIPYTGYSVSGGAVPGRAADPHQRRLRQPPLFHRLSDVSFVQRRASPAPSPSPSPGRMTGGSGSPARWSSTWTARAWGTRSPTPSAAASCTSATTGIGTAGPPSAPGEATTAASPPWIDDVTFVADPDVSGLVEIPYTGRSTGGRSFDGTVLISVSSGTAQPVRYYGGSLPLQLEAASFRNACASQLPGDLNYITFPTLPASLYGQLKVDYVRPNTGTPALPDTLYYVD